METIAPLSPLPTTAENPITQDDPQELQNSNLTKVSSKTKVKAEIEITTLEGDHVTLSAKSALKTFYATYNSNGQIEGSDQTAQMTVYKTAFSNKVSMEVEGSLNEAELADIQRLIQSIEGTLKDSLSGDLDGAMQQALQMTSLGTLSSFDAEMQYSQRIRGMELTYQPLNTAPALNPAPVPENADLQNSTSPASRRTEGVSENESEGVTPSVTAFKAKLYASLHLSGTQSLPETPSAINPVVTPVETEAQAADASPATAPAPESTSSVPPPGETESTAMNTRLQINISRKMFAGLKGYGMDGVNVPSFSPESRMGTVDLFVLRQIMDLDNRLIASPVTTEKPSLVQV